MILNKDTTLMYSLMCYLFKRLKIKIKRVGIYNHKYLQAEHSSKSLSTILINHLVNLGDTWHKYVSLASMAYNTFNSSGLANMLCMNYIWKKTKIII